MNPSGMRSDRLRRFPNSGPDEAQAGPPPVSPLRWKPSLHLPPGHHRGLRVTMKRALLVIDVQNEYFTGATADHLSARHLDNILRVMDAAPSAACPSWSSSTPSHRRTCPFSSGGPTPGSSTRGGLPSERPLAIEKTLPGALRHQPGGLAPQGAGSTPSRSQGT